MDRRRYLAALGAGLLGGLAGCSGARSPTAGEREATPTAADGTATGGTTAGTPTETTAGGGVGDVDIPVPRSELIRGAPKDAIPAITDPAFGPDWGDTEWTLADDDQVIGVARDGAARAYPLRVLDWHEVVNDTFAGPLLVTYCPLCGSGVTGVRTVDGEPTVFGVSGLLWNSDLVMYDRKTESLWSQLLGRAIRGPKAGTYVEFVPSTLTTLGAWREAHPDTAVLLPPPASGTISDAEPRDYGTDPYGGYDYSDRVGIGANDFSDDRLHPKTVVVGVEHGDVARAYPVPRLEAEGVVNDEVDGLPVVVTLDPGDSPVAYVRRVDGQVLTFRRADERHLAAGGSRWEVVTGEAVDGPHEGTTLERANDTSPQFWFAWADFHPNTEIYGAG